MKHAIACILFFIIVNPVFSEDQHSDAQTDFKLYQEYKAELIADEDATDEDWITLAEWAKQTGLAWCYKDVVRVMAKRNPRLPWTQDHMRKIGFYWDEDLATKFGNEYGWITEDEYLEMKGYIKFRGEWVTWEWKRYVLDVEQEQERWDNTTAHCRTCPRPEIDYDRKKLPEHLTYTQDREEKEESAENE